MVAAFLGYTFQNSLTMKFIPQLLASIICATAVSAASAAAVTVTFDNPIFSGFTGTASDAVQIKAKSGVVTKTWNVSAGRFQGTGSNVVGVPETIFVDGLSDLYAYCYDIYESIQGGQTVNYTINFDGVFARTLDFLGAVNSVLSAGGSYDPYAWLHPTNGLMGAAIQLGIWESKYDTNATWSLAAGNFQATGLESATQGYFNQFIAAMPSTNALESKYVMVLEAPGAQDMIVGDPPVEVPEPSTLLLAGGALLAMVASQRRRARKV